MHRVSVVLVALSGCTTYYAPHAATPAAPRAATPAPEPARGGVADAVVGFDGLSNGMVDEETHRQDQAEFDEQEEIESGLGPIFNAHSCRDCHENPVAGGSAQVTELRAGHRNAQGEFVFPEVRLGNGTIVTGRTLINDKAICPGAEFPDLNAQEHLPEGENVRALRLSISLLGDGYVEAVPDELLSAIAQWQCGQPALGVCGLPVKVPVLEVPGVMRIGRFGWKAEQASLLSFSADAYLNEMGITSVLRPTDVTTLCDSVADPEDQPDALGMSDIDRFARFIRATKAPPRDARLAATPAARNGSTHFETIGCAICHAPTLTTHPPGTTLYGGSYRVPAALGNRTLHPYSDYLLHDVGTGDGIPIAVPEHHGPGFSGLQATLAETAFRMRTAPLWGLRTRSRLMHDGASATLREAIARHQNEAEKVRQAFDALPPAAQEELLSFLRSL